MAEHETAHIHAAFDALNAALVRELPHDIVLLVVQLWTVGCVSGYPELVLCPIVTLEIFVEEVAAGIDNRTYAIGVCHQFTQTL